MPNFASSGFPIMAFPCLNDPGLYRSEMNPGSPIARSIYSRCSSASRLISAPLAYAALVVDIEGRRVPCRERFYCSLREWKSFWHAADCTMRPSEEKKPLNRERTRVRRRGDQL